MEGETDSLIVIQDDLVRGSNLFFEDSILFGYDGFAEIIETSQPGVWSTWRSGKFERVDNVQPILSAEIENAGLVLRHGIRVESVFL